MWTTRLHYLLYLPQSSPQCGLQDCITYYSCHKARHNVDYKIALLAIPATKLGTMWTTRLHYLLFLPQSSPQCGLQDCITCYSCHKARHWGGADYYAAPCSLTPPTAINFHRRVLTPPRKSVLEVISISVIEARC